MVIEMAEQQLQQVIDYSNPYGHWTSINSLEAEAKRFNRAAPAQHNTSIIKHWRTNQVFLISQRIDELKRIHRHNRGR